MYNDLFENDTNRTSDNNEAFSMPEIAKRDNVMIVYLAPLLELK